MTRSKESAADERLRAQLADEGMPISRYQLERWRARGLLARPMVVRTRFGGSEVADHGEETLDAARVLAEISSQGRAWQWCGVFLFDEGYSLSPVCLQACATWFVERVQSKVRSYWEEAGRLSPLRIEDGEERRLDQAEIAVALLKDAPRMRPLVRSIRLAVEQQLPQGSAQERREALHTALTYRVLDMGDPGTLTKDEEYLAITGRDLSSNPSITPLTPSDIAFVARTITPAEAEIGRAWLNAAWNADLIPRPEVFFILENVLVLVAEFRRSEEGQGIELPIPSSFLDELGQDAREMDEEYQAGRIPGQLELDFEL